MDKESFIRICNESNSMDQASRKIPYTIKKFIKLAKEYGCYISNQGGKGMKKKSTPIIPIEDIFNGKRKLLNWQFKIRLIREGYKEDKCEKCGISEWKGKRLSIQVHHKDGNKDNNKLENIEFLCPNCHSQTDNFSGKNKKNKL
jgi:5-methylcytosine-specific restriction endonuclease McrA